MDKLLAYEGKTDKGVFTFVIDEEQKYLTKTASEYHPTIASYIANAKKIPGMTQLLITALGAGEWWGANNNGDFFGESELAHEGSDYGFKTFQLNAKLFKHHVNKPTSQHYGKVLLSVYNPNYHRVELVIGVDHSLAPDIIENIEQGVYPQYSMGCKIPYDICSICGNKAPNKKYYCEHIKYQLNTIDSVTGKKVYTINVRPKFFDISVVIVPADKTSVTLKKIASQIGGTKKTAGGIAVSSVLAAELAKEAFLKKEADIEKEIISDTPPATVDLIKNKDLRSYLTMLPDVLNEEEKIPSSTLNQIANSAPLNEIIPTFINHMIMPKPQEFQRIVLISIGKPDVADKLDQINTCFDASYGIPDEYPLHPDLRSYLGLDSANINSDVSSLLLPFLSERSYAPDIFSKRIFRLEKQAAYIHNPYGFGEHLTLPRIISLPPPQYEEPHHEMSNLKLLGLMALLYAGLSKGVLSNLIRSTASLGLKHPLNTLKILGSAGIAHSLMPSHHINPDAFYGGNYVHNSYSNPDGNNIVERVENMREHPYIKIGGVTPVNKGKAVLRRVLVAGAIPMVAHQLQKIHDSNPSSSELKVTKFIRQHPKLLTGLTLTDALLAAEGKGTLMVTKHLGTIQDAFLKESSLNTSSLKESNLKIAANVIDDIPKGIKNPSNENSSLKEFAINSVVWPLAMGTGNLPGRILGSIIDQSAITLGGKLADRYKKRNDSIA